MLTNLFGPQPKFTIKNDLGAALDSEEFIQFLILVTDGTRRRSRVRRLKNGAEFSPEYLPAVRGAKRPVNQSCDRLALNTEDGIAPRSLLWLSVWPASSGASYVPTHRDKAATDGAPGTDVSVAETGRGLAARDGVADPSTSSSVKCAPDSAQDDLGF